MAPLTQGRREARYNPSVRPYTGKAKSGIVSSSDKFVSGRKAAVKKIHKILLNCVEGIGIIIP